MDMQSPPPSDCHQVFQNVVLPHLADAHRLARYFTGSSVDADDVLQEASVRMLRFASGFRGGDARSWVMRIVRNAAFTWLRTNRRPHQISLGEFQEGGDDMPEPFAVVAAQGDDADPLIMAMRSSAAEVLFQALDRLEPDHREILVLRDFDGLSYRDIAATLGIPIGTVMSRLSRAHKVLGKRLAL